MTHLWAVAFCDESPDVSLDQCASFCNNHPYCDYFEFDGHGGGKGGCHAWTGKLAAAGTSGDEGTVCYKVARAATNPGCKAGEYAHGAACKPCPAGTHTDQGFQRSCVPDHGKPVCTGGGTQWH
jgi:hypothetical protein